MSVRMLARAQGPVLPRARLLAAQLLASLALAAGCGAPGAGGAEIPELRTFAVREAPFDVEHYAIELDLDPAARRISGSTMVRLYPRGRALSRVQLDFTDLSVGGVKDER